MLKMEDLKVGDIVKDKKGGYYTVTDKILPKMDTLLAIQVAGSAQIYRKLVEYQKKKCG